MRHCVGRAKEANRLGGQNRLASNHGMNIKRLAALVKHFATRTKLAAGKVRRIDPDSFTCNAPAFY